MKGVFIRHPQTDINNERTVFSRRDPDLNLLGYSQAHLIANWLVSRPVKLVVSSPLKRALEVARLIAVDHGLDVIEDPRLREVDFGELEGVKMDEVRARYPDLVVAWSTTPSRVRWPGGEDLRGAVERMEEAVEEYAKRLPESLVVFVTHGIILKAYLCKVMGIEIDNFRVLKVDLGSVSVVDFGPERNVVELVNYVPWER